MTDENYAKMRNVKSCFPVELGSVGQRKSFMFGKHNDPIHNTVAVEKNYCIIGDLMKDTEIEIEGQK